MARWSTSNISDLTGHVAVITGANSGLGFESATTLARHGATVVMACRDEARCTAAAANIEGAGLSGRVEPMLLDLADLDSVRAFATAFDERHQRLDILMNNGGVMAPPERLTTKQGFELQLGTNHLGHFALTGLLLPTLLGTVGSRVVTVSSFAHEFGRVDFGNLQREHGYAPYAAYGQSKLANLMFMVELDRRLRRADARTLSVGAHPGFVSTNLQAAGPFLGAPRLSSWLVLAGVRLIGQSAAHGAEPQLYAATAPGVQGGDYYGPGRRIGGHTSRSGMATKARDLATATRLWDVSTKLTGVNLDAVIAANVEVSAR